MTLKSKLLAAFAFDKRKFASLCLPNSTAHVFMNGAKAENERFLPLLTAMAEVCEAAEAISLEFDYGGNHESDREGLPYIRGSSLLSDKLEALRKMVEEK